MVCAPFQAAQSASGSQAGRQSPLPVLAVFSLFISLPLLPLLLFFPLLCSPLRLSRPTLFHLPPFTALRPLQSSSVQTLSLPPFLPLLPLPPPSTYQPSIHPFSSLLLRLLLSSLCLFILTPLLPTRPLSLPAKNWPKPTSCPSSCRALRASASAFRNYGCSYD